ncbi:VacJ family lipoprotein [Microbulbifer sp. YPW16]|uniref:MlaA family lipoprotein n=1 Tax=unclassified Microbulbifer TaxID=2619833 RepID=UPI001E3676ED|nr:VacJ family lipoprotein [Microbulbifer sp. YPW16]UHQ54758.1 MlaA family lipoprotein [Microbulbifer sp. YPW16]
MLGRTVKSPWLLATLLAASPMLVQAAQEDPFANGGAAPVAEQPQGGAAESGSEASGPAPASPPAESPAPDAGAADPDDSDPFAEGGEGSSPAAEETGDSGDYSLEDEYGFDPAEEFSSEEGEEPGERDPWEGFNRAVFRFNDTADRWVLKPMAVTYRQVTPIFMQHGVSNFFGNLFEITNSFNSVLQWKWGEAGNGAGRFLINSTVGVAGLFDVAEHVGLEPTDGEDFDQTLAVWGVPSGPYLVLPFFGPSTVRGVPGMAVDYYTDPLNYIDHSQTRYSLQFTDLIQTRASLLKTESLLQGDRYVLLRDAYLQRRDFLIRDGDVEDDFGDDADSFGGDDDPFGGGAEADADTATGESDPFGGDPFGDGGEDAGADEQPAAPAPDSESGTTGSSGDAATEADVFDS